MELWDILDKNGKPKGYTHERGKPVADGDYHLVVEVFVTTPDKQLLLMRRHPAKPFGNSWEITGGAAVAGEDSLTAVQRELSEETGIFLPKDAFVFLKTIVGNHAIYDFYHAECNVPLDAVKFQENETVGARFATAQEFIRLVSDGEICQPVADRHYDDILKELQKHEDSCS